MTILVAVGDLHCNSTIGLCPPRVTLDDGGTYQHNKAQAWTWLRWLDFWADAKKFIKPKKKRKRPFYLVLNGDLVDGDHHGTPQLVSRNMADQHRITLKALEPALDLKPDHLFIIRGTEAHVGKSAQWEEFLGQDLDAEPDPDTGTYSWWTCQIIIDGLKIDLAHHGSKGRLPWTSVNGAEKISDVVMANHYRRGEKPPDIAIRSHVHDLILAGENKATRVVVLPSWQLSTAFGHRIDPGGILPVGGVIIDIDKRWGELEGGRQYKLFPHKYEPPRKEPWQAMKK